MGRVAIVAAIWFAFWIVVGAVVGGLTSGGHGGVQEVYEAASIIGRLQKGPKRPRGEGWSIEDHQAIADLEKVQMKLVKLANGVQE